MLARAVLYRGNKKLSLCASKKMKYRNINVEKHT